jgi:predicted Zn-dependent peptidase
VSGGLVPTADPFLYTVSVTAASGTPLERLEEAALSAIESVRTTGITDAELKKAMHQLRARLVFESDSITNIAHQLGYFETIGSWRDVASLESRIAAVTLEQVAEAAARRLNASNRTVGWFQPQ